MNKLIIILFLLFSLCFSSEDIREVIIERYDNGNKKILVKYSGQGSDEIILERITYTKDNKIFTNNSISNTSIFESSFRSPTVHSSQSEVSWYPTSVWVKQLG